MQEGFIVTYRDIIAKSEKPADDLYDFYLEFFELQRNLEIYKAIARSVKLFGRFIVFKAILSLESMNNIDHKNIYPLLRFMCNKIMEPMEASKPPSLVEYRDNMKKLSEKARHTKWKVGKPFDD